jgi:uncharacterized RDD family membrane protein YckC
VKAGIPSRLGAFLLDELVLLAVLIVVGIIAYFAGVHIGGSYVDWDPESILIILCAAALSYFLLFLWFLARGQTPGKWLVDIRAVDKRNGSEPGLGRMLLRETFGKWVSGCFFGLGWFWVIWDRDAQAWHDKIARTVVLYRRSQSSKYLAVLLLFGVPVLSVAFLWASLITRTRPQRGGEGIAMLPSMESKRPSQEAAAVRVPFIGCSSDGQSGPVPAPKGDVKVVQVDASAAQRLAYYESAQYTGSGVLAPRGWYCFGTYGSDGSHLFVTPQPINSDDLFSTAGGGFIGPAIQASTISGETSGRLEVARVIARVFPAQQAFVQSQIEEGIPSSDFPLGPYPKDKLIFQSDRIVEYQTPPHSEGLGTTVGSLQANDYPVNAVAILKGQAPDLLILMVRLPPGLNDLTSHIIQQMERDNAVSLSNEVSALNNQQHLVPSTGFAQVSVLGFRFGESAKDMGERAGSMGFHLGDCDQRSANAPEYVDCQLARDNGDSLTVTFLKGGLQRLDLKFRIENYDQVLKAIQRDHGIPRLVVLPGGTYLEWGSLTGPFDIDLDRADDMKEGHLEAVDLSRSQLD